MNSLLIVAGSVCQREVQQIVRSPGFARDDVLNGDAASSSCVEAQRTVADQALTNPVAINELERCIRFCNRSDLFLPIAGLSGGCLCHDFLVIG